MHFQVGKSQGHSFIQPELQRSLMKYISEPFAPWIKGKKHYWSPPSIHQRQPYRCQLPTFPVAHAWVPKRFCPLGRKQEVIHCRPKVRHCQAALQWSKSCDLVTATVAGVSGRATRIGGWTWCTEMYIMCHRAI